jgi:glycosyltransferase involved in cell wall biosynthesis
VADLGVFPTKFEAFGLVFLECIACGTPVIGTAAGGPLEFVDASVGELVFDHESNEDFALALGETISRSLLENWKPQRREAALRVASGYTLTVQCESMLRGVDGV